jgi:hypothetical protein
MAAVQAELDRVERETIDLLRRDGFALAVEDADFIKRLVERLAIEEG